MLNDLLSRDGLLLSHDLREFVHDPRSLARDVDRGLLVRLRRGAYVSGQVWRGSTRDEKYLFRIRAVAEMSSRPLVFTGLSAAAIWGMPVAREWPTEVYIAENWRGGGRSEPGIRVSAAGFPTARVAHVDEYSVTDLARTALSVARPVPMMDGVGSLDWVLWRGNNRRIGFQELCDDLENWHPRTGYWNLQKSVAFATHLSDSFGESRARVAIHIAGFEDPDLQVEFVDGQGTMRADFCWQRERVVVEFDGKVKYTNQEHTGGDPSLVVFNEKKRQDRLARLGQSVDRLTTHEIDHPDLLKQILQQAGVPRRR